MVNSASSLFDLVCAVPEGLLPILLIIAAIIIWVIAKVVQNVRKSAAQWEEVDKSKLREWEDDD